MGIHGGKVAEHGTTVFRLRDIPGRRLRDLTRFRNKELGTAKEFPKEGGWRGLGLL